MTLRRMPVVKISEAVVRWPIGRGRGRNRPPAPPSSAAWPSSGRRTRRSSAPSSARPPGPAAARRCPRRGRRGRALRRRQGDAPDRPGPGWATTSTATSPICSRRWMGGSGHREGGVDDAPANRPSMRSVLGGQSSPPAASAVRRVERADLRAQGQQCQV
jgi:hypothetical protein